MIKHIFCALLVSCMLVSCNDFVDIVPKGNTIPQTVDDLAKMMNNGSLAYSDDVFEIAGVACGVLMMELYSDDYTVSENPESALCQMYAADLRTDRMMKWDDYVYDVAESDMNWDNLYHANYIANYVLNNIETVDEGSSYRREEVKGIALVHRAMNYFLLVNIYGKQYTKAAAGTDLGVPLILEADINKSLPRATVADVYDQIIKDLDEALASLKVDVPEFNHIPGRATAYAVRAKVKLWMQDYDGAYNDAVEALKLRSTMINYNECSMVFPGMPMYGIGGYDPIIATNPEIMYTRYVSERAQSIYSPKRESIINKENDLRYRLFMGAMPAYGFLEEVSWTKHRHSGIDVSEVWLTKSEAALRKSNPDIKDALEALNHVREYRYDALTYNPVTETNPALLLKEILTERRREMMYTELSFLEKKRLNVDPQTAAPMTRSWKGKTYTLPVGDPRWEWPIPRNVIALNSQLEQNER